MTVHVALIEKKHNYTLYRVVSNCFYTNTYILVSGKDMLIVDPGFDKQHVDLINEVVRLAASSEVKRATIYLTHGHLDHFCSDLTLKRKLETSGIDAKILIHEQDAYLLRDFTEHMQIGNTLVPEYNLEIFPAQPHDPDLCVRDEDTVNVGNIVFKVLHCPGHTRGSTVLVAEDFSFTGDVLLDGGIGRVDLPHSNPSEMRRSIYRILGTLNPDIKVFPGHGEPFQLGSQVTLVLALASRL